MNNSSYECEVFCYSRSPTGCLPTGVLLHISEADGEVGGMNGFGRGNRSTRRKPAPTPLCPTCQTRARTRAAAVGSQRLTASAMARPKMSIRLDTKNHQLTVNRFNLSKPTPILPKGWLHYLSRFRLSIYGSAAIADLARFFSFLILYAVGSTPWPGDQPVARPLPT
jgi:hypothetical protein